MQSNKAARKKAVKGSKELEASLAKLRTEILGIAGSSVPGKEINDVIGIVRGISDTQATSKEQFELAEKEALYKLLTEAKTLGANAVIDMKVETGSYAQQGSQWQVSQAVYTGTAVVTRS